MFGVVMRAIDTNLLVRLLVRDDAKQLGATEKFIATGAWVSTLVLVETLWVLDAVYQRSAAQIAAAIDLLLTHSALTLQEADVVSAALKQFEVAPAVGFSDCLILETARKAGHMPLGSFDKQLAKLPGVVRV